MLDFGCLNAEMWNQVGNVVAPPKHCLGKSTSASSLYDNPKDDIIEKSMYMYK